ncbi:MAG: hypothetical protein QM768_07380 [Agriterribacter sp.]
MSFKKLLAEFDSVLKEFNPLEYNKLLAPFSPKETELKLINELGINDSNFKDFFSWKNGEEEDSYCEIMEYGGPMSIDAIKETISNYFHFEPMLIPFISEGEQMLLFNKKNGRNYGKIYLYSVPELYIEHPISYYDSFESMISTTITAYKKKIYSYDFSKKKLRYDYDELHRHIKEMNPNSEFWKNHNPLRSEDWYEI